MPHIVRRVSIRGGKAETLYRAGEFLGLSPDGALLLCRLTDESRSANEVEVVSVDGRPLTRIVLPPGHGSPRWGADSRTLVQVRKTGAGSGIWKVPICLTC